jgi:DNA repair exonuclease SbcCD nuclease subunit
MKLSQLGMPKDKVEQRQRELRDVLTRVCDLVKSEGIELLLIPGDLFDYESCKLDTMNFVIEQFSRILPTPVVICPGNHDYYSPSSFYNSDYLAQRGQQVWPSNVYIVKTPEWGIFVLEGLNNVAITSCVHTQNRGIEQRELAMPLPKREGMLNLLLFHGSRLNYVPEGKKVTLPFTDEELLSQGFDYAAIGHYHSYSEITDAEGVVRGAYSGCPAGRDLSESGEKYVLLGNVDEDHRVTLEKIRVDQRCIYSLEVSCTGLTHSEAVLNKIAQKVKEKTTDKYDIVFVKLTGLMPPDFEIDIPPHFMAHDYFHLKIDPSRVEPDYDLGLRRIDDSVQGKFVRRMQEMERQAGDEHEAKNYHNALLYGLDALIQKKVRPRYED